MQATEKTPHAERRALRPARPKVLMHSKLRKTAFASGPRVQRAPGVPHALSQGGRECERRRRPRAANNGGDDACLKHRGCLTFTSAMARRHQRNPSPLWGGSADRPGWGCHKRCSRVLRHPTRHVARKCSQRATLPTTRLRRLREGKGRAPLHYLSTPSPSACRGSHRPAGRSVPAACSPARR